ncbi:trans-resveratrol di-O-methyltransferase-like [Pyrus communis]|uniref:trans-resveratrol di-O-methyltransferase-like n=1 Tax=Pyrus communis TaxID=23211 RepID=UPI0035BFA736
MALSNREVGATSHELLGAQAHVWNHIFQFINSMSLKCAVQLGIPDVIHNHGQTISLSELIAGLNIHPSKAHFISRLMRILVHSNFFAQHQHVHHNHDNVEEEEAVEFYSLTPASRLFLKDGPLNTTPFLLMILDPVMTDPFHSMGAWLQMNGGDDLVPRTPFEVANGMPFWELSAKKPRFGDSFNEAMEADSKLITRAVVEECGGVFEGLKSLVDVGGGTGTMAKAIANAFPNINCTVFDQPHVVADLEGTTHNLGFAGGDMFDKIPPANAILLKWILHDWNDEESVKILKKCREAMLLSKNEGRKKIIIIDIVVGYVNNKMQLDKKSIETQLMFDMLMMSTVTSKERSELEWEKIFLAAGFTRYNITHTLGLRSLIEVYL